MLVEVDVTKPRRKKLTFRCGGHTFTTRIIFEDNPRACINCRTPGHGMGQCMADPKPLPPGDMDFTHDYEPFDDLPPPPPPLPNNQQQKHEQHEDNLGGSVQSQPNQEGKGAFMNHRINGPIVDNGHMHLHNAETRVTQVVHPSVYVQPVTLEAERATTSQGSNNLNMGDAI